MPEIDQKTNDAINGIYNGTLAHSIKKNARYALTGVVVGSIIGILLARLFGKSKILYATAGGLGGAGIGYLAAPKEKTE